MRRAPRLAIPQVDQCQAVLAEQPGDVVTAVGRDQRVIGLAADAVEARDLRLTRLRQVGDADRLGIEQRVREAPARQIDQAHHARTLALRGERRDVGHQLERARVEHLDAARRVVLRRHQRAVGRDRAADRIAGLQHTRVDALLQQVDARQRAVAAEHEGAGAVAREHHRGVRQVAQPGHLGQQRAAAGVDDGHACRARARPRCRGRRCPCQCVRARRSRRASPARWLLRRALPEDGAASSRCPR